MKFGVREICDVVFKAKATVKIGSKTFQKGQPVLYIDTAKTSTMEQAATTVYATGGKGNSRLIAWEGEKTLTFTVEDALLSPMGLAILSGAGLMDAATDNVVHVHTTATAFVDADGNIDLSDTLEIDEEISADAPVFVMVTETDGSLTGDMISNLEIGEVSRTLADGNTEQKKQKLTGAADHKNKTVFVDFYIAKTSGATEFTIDAGNFAGYYYVEASTLFRRQDNGKDMPAELVFPNVKVQSNFTFSMAATGDPSTFTFTMDAVPGYTLFDPTKKVLCAIQLVNGAGAVEVDSKSHDSIKDPATTEED